MLRSSVNLTWGTDTIRFLWSLATRLKHPLPIAMAHFNLPLFPSVYPLLHPPFNIWWIKYFLVYLIKVCHVTWTIYWSTHILLMNILKFWMRFFHYYLNINCFWRNPNVVYFLNKLIFLGMLWVHVVLLWKVVKWKLFGIGQPHLLLHTYNDF